MPNHHAYNHLIDNLFKSFSMKNSQFSLVFNPPVKELAPTSYQYCAANLLLASLAESQARHGADLSEIC